MTSNFETNKIYNKDCLQGLREMLQSNIRADCVITDPPYLINYCSHHRQNKDHKFCKTIQNDDNPQLIIDLMPLLYDVMKDNTPLYMFCGSDKVDFFKSEVDKFFTVKNLIVWDKGNHTAGDLALNTGNLTSLLFTQIKGVRRLLTERDGSTIYGEYRKSQEKSKYTKIKNRSIF